MKIIFFIPLVFLLVYLFAVYKQTSYLINISANLTLDARSFSRESAAGKNFLVIGDSTAVGAGAANQNDSIAGRLGSDYPEANIANLGVNGSKTHELIVRLTSLGDKRYDFILIQIGANDIVRRTNLAELKQSIDIVLVEAKKHADQVMLMTDDVEAIQWACVGILSQEWPNDKQHIRMAALGAESELKLKYPQVVESKYVVGVFVSKQNAVNDADFLAQ